MKKLTLLLLMLFAFSSFLSATDYTSLGSGDWSTTTNWSPNGLPGPGDKVIIAAGHTITTSDNYEILDLDIAATAKLSCLLFDISFTNETGTILINGDMVVENLNLTGNGKAMASFVLNGNLQVDGTFNYGKTAVTGDGIINAAMYSGNTGKGTIFGISNPVNGETYGGSTWTGTNSSDWNVAGNWFSGTLPSATSSVVVKSVPNTPIVTNSSAANAKSIVIESGNLTISAGAELTVAENITNEVGAGALIIESTASGSGSLIYASGTPAATVQRFVPQNEWHYIATPVTGTVAADFKQPSGLVWLLELQNENTWSYLIDESSPVVRGHGYSYWIEQTVKADQTLNLVGNLTADLSTPISLYDDGTGGDNTYFTFVGNPYTSSLDITKMPAVETGIEQTVWIWDETLDGFLWASMTDPDGTNSGNYPAGADPSAIALGQGFYVRATQSSASFGFDPSIKAHNENAQFYKKSTGSSGQSNSVKLTLTKDGRSDLGIISFADNGSTSFENGFDITKLFGAETNSYLYFVEEDHEYCKNHLSSLGSGEQRIVDMYCIAGTNGEHSISSDLSGLAEATVFLEDLVTGDMIDLSEGSNYNFNADIGENELRFRLHFNAMYTGLENPETNKEDKSIRIYTYDNAVYLTNIGEKSKTIDVSIYDLVGRQVYENQTRLFDMERIPLNLKNSYLVVKVMFDNNVITKKVFLK